VKNGVTPVESKSDDLDYLKRRLENVCITRKAEGTLKKVT